MYHMSLVMCHKSHVMCHMAGVRCQVTGVFIFYKVVRLVGGGSVMNGAYPV